MDGLDDDTRLHILKFLKGYEVARLSAVNKSWNGLIRQGLIWRGILSEELKVDLTKIHGLSSVELMDLYKENKVLRDMAVVEWRRIPTSRSVEGREMHTATYLKELGVVAFVAGWTQWNGPVDQILAMKVDSVPTSPNYLVNVACSGSRLHAVYGHTAVVPTTLGNNVVCVFGGMLFGGALQHIFCEI